MTVRNDVVGSLNLSTNNKNPKTEEITYNVLMVIGVIVVYLGAFVVDDGYTLFFFSSIAEFIFLYKAKKSVLKWLTIILFTPLVLICLYMIGILILIVPAFG